MPDVQAGSLYGTLNLLVLRTLSGRETLHGLEIQRRIRHVSMDVLQIEVGALYPALHRLERDGLLASEWGISDSRRRAKFYAITAKGLKRLERETKQWESHTAAVGRVLTEAPESAG
jgi:transcriptional regulator